MAAPIPSNEWTWAHTTLADQPYNLISFFLRTINKHRFAPLPMSFLYRTKSSVQSLCC